jgi:DNA ligase-1
MHRTRPARAAAWLKIKAAHTLDLVVLRSSGSGRRSKWLSNIHLGARDPASGGFGCSARRSGHD